MSSAASSGISSSSESLGWPCSCLDRFLSSLSAPSRYSSLLFTWRDSILFFRRKPPLALEPDRSRPSGERLSSLPLLLLTLSTRSSTKVLNSFGANSGWSLAGTQNILPGSSSSAECPGATVGKEGRSGSAVSTFIDIRLIACKLLNSCATAAGLDS
jgi:hypothetical protein